LDVVPVHRRNFGLMFQDYALFPHRNVAENVAFGLRMQQLGDAEVQARTRLALEQVNLSTFASRRVTDLSGGEQQRVALARALAPRPRLLMLDEPLGALDRALRGQLIEELRRVLHQAGIPAIYVTHDQEEAFALSDRLVMLRDGRVEQTGAPQEVYALPSTQWVARFLGLTNLVPAQVIGLQPFEVSCELGVFRPADRGTSGFILGEAVNLLVRPAGVTPAGTMSVNSLRGRVEDVIFQGENFRVEMSCGAGIRLQFTLPAPLPLGQEITLAVDPLAVICLKG
jgi:spermidine/putrescine transport system ATP-binding protein